jgi:hypothetical protein
VETEIELEGGGITAGVVRVGDTVRRPTGPWTPTVHSFLRHLEARGFDGAPRVLGVDGQEREILTYVDGDVPSSSSWRRGHATRLPDAALGDDSLVAVARLIRALHEAAADFAPQAAIWREHAYPTLPGEIVCHGDVGPHNTVYRDGEPVGLIDWDGARPNDPRLELAHAAWTFVPLADDAYCAEMGFAAPPDRGARLGLFADAYGIARADILGRAREARQREAERLRYWPVTAAEASDFLLALSRELAWLASNEDALRRSLTSAA